MGQANSPKKTEEVSDLANHEIVVLAAGLVGGRSLRTANGRMAADLRITSRNGRFFFTLYAEGVRPGNSAAAR